MGTIPEEGGHRNLSPFRQHVPGHAPLSSQSCELEAGGTKIEMAFLPRKRSLSSGRDAPSLLYI